MQSITLFLLLVIHLVASDNYDYYQPTFDRDDYPYSNEYPPPPRDLYYQSDPYAETAAAPPGYYQDDRYNYPQYASGGAYYHVDPYAAFHPHWRDVSTSQDFGIDRWTGEPNLTKSPTRQMIDFVRLLNRIEQLRNNYY